MRTDGYDPQSHKGSSFSGTNALLGTLLHLFAQYIQIMLMMICMRIELGIFTQDTILLQVLLPEEILLMSQVMGMVHRTRRVRQVEVRILPTQVLLVPVMMMMILSISSGIL